MSEPKAEAKAIFLAALECEGAEALSRFLDEACGGDAALRQRVEELLQANRDAGSFLGGVEKPEATLHEPPAASLGMVIGSYKLIEQIGEGGMGAVWMAQQTEPVKRVVAIKLIKAGMDSKQVIARFEAERQALALMDHPNIARVLDAGATDNGRPYFVMDLVKGVPLTKYCDERHLTPQQRLELFIPVCQAVQHAHQKGIIHRDLKPSNVLVALYDGKPVPKVIDFGVAKAAGQPLTEQTLVTGFGAIIGTLEYMSPEQAEINQLDIDTRSDIYSLGVMLYELLTGSPPFSRIDLEKAGMMEMLRVIREQEPSKPSTKLSTAVGLAGLAANRGMEPAKLTRLVRGELDWIVMKALEKDRSRRYETANGFALDIQRYLADEPVLAGPPSAWYRFSKFARRNRWQLTVAAALALLLLGAGVFAWYADRQAAQRRADVAKQEGDERTRLGRNAEAVAALISQCEDDLRAEQAERAAVALTEAERRSADNGAEDFADRLARCRADLKLLRALNDIDTFRWTWSGRSFPDQTIVAARWQAALADYGLIADERQAGEAAAKVNACMVRERLLTALDGWLKRDPSAAVRAALGKVLRSADPDPYRNALRDALAARLDPPVLALAAQPEALEQPPWFAATLGQLELLPLDRTRAVLESALRVRPGDLHLLMALGTTYHSKRRRVGVEERVRWYQAAVAAHPQNLAARTNLGLALLDSGNWDAALVCFQEIIRLDSKCALAHNNMGWIRQLKGDEPGAIAAYRDAIEADRNLALAHGNLGAILLGRNLEEAIRVLREAVRLDPDEPVSHHNLAQALLQKGEWKEAEETLSKCLALLRKTAPDDWQTFKTMIMLGSARLEQEKYADAESPLFEGLVGMHKCGKTLPAPWTRRIIQVVQDVAQLYDAMDKKGEAAKWRAIREKCEGAPVGSVRDVGEGLKLHGKLDGKTASLVFEVMLSAGKTYEIHMASPDQRALDPLLVLQNADGQRLAEDDDSGGGLNACIVYRAPRDGVYRIRATSFNDGSGEFTLTVREQK